MTAEIAALLLLILSAAILFFTEALRVDVVAMLILVALALSGLVTPEESLSGFSSPATATVAAMFILSAALSRTGVVDGLAAALGKMAGRRPFLLYLSLLVLGAVLSGFINNTAAIAVFIPLVLGLCQSHGGQPGRFLMPLSFAAQVGGTCTLIGTSTNILVSDITRRAGEPPFGMFEFTAMGALFAAVGMAYLTVAPRFLLRYRPIDRDEPLAERYQLARFLAELEVTADSRYAGKTLSEAGLENRLDLEVLEIIRGSATLWLPSPQEVLAAGDILLVRAPVKELLAARSLPGLKFRGDLEDDDARVEGGDVILMEAVVPPGSRLVGRTLKQTQFRRRHRSQALAIRHHDRLRASKVGKVPLSVGDVLLLQGHRDELERMRGGSELIPLEEIQPHIPRLRPALLAMGILVGVVTLASLDVAPILVTAMAGCFALVLLRILTVEQMYDAIDWKVIFLLAGVIPLGIALDSTGASRLLAGALASHLGPYGPWLVLSALYILTSLLTELMSNNATAALLAPLALALAAEMGVSPRPFLLAVMFAASNSFLTPVGYQTNAMVMGPGGYRFGDFTRLGAPLNLIFWIMATLLIPRFFPF